MNKIEEEIIIQTNELCSLYELSKEEEFTMRMLYTKIQELNLDQHKQLKVLKALVAIQEMVLDLSKEIK